MRRGRDTHSFDGESRTCMGIVPAAEMWTIVASCSEMLTLSRDETVTSVL